MCGHKVRWLVRVVRWPVLAAALVLVAPTVRGEAVEAQKDAPQLVRDALHCEIYGWNQQRAKLLEEAAQLDPDCAPAMWHRGYVKVGDRWVNALDYGQVVSSDSRWTQYQHRRSRTPDTVEGHLALAQWCRQHGMIDQWRAHLTQVLRIDPDNRTARSQLGFRRVNGAWVSSQEIQEAIDELQNDRRALARWQPTMQEILAGLHHRSQLKQQTAQQRLLQISDPDAIPALEAFISRASQQASMLVLQVLQNMPHPAAAQSLARHAVFSPWQQVREEAARKLRDRQPDTYIPYLLGMLYTPVESRMEIYRGPGGRLMYRHVFFREGQSENQLLVLETAYRRIAMPGGDRDETLARALLDVSQRAQTAEQQVELQNRATVELNNRVSQALSTATRQVIPGDPEQWWDWWTQYNEVYIEGQKPTRTIQQTQQIAIADRPVLSGGNQFGQVGQAQYPLDCLAPGTLIWTANGPRPVESIQVGDLVLSQNVETGELAYKPVLRTTVRPMSKLMRFQVDGETIEASGGHPFWVAGEGWVKARDLQPAMPLHCLSTTHLPTRPQPGRESKSYNLIVADFHTYFVGNSRILSHDNTMREPTSAVVPGLVEQ